MRHTAKSGHLPECEMNDAIPHVHDDCGMGVYCCCERLRACEQRVLDAAREAVERVSSLLQPLGPALAAIDALREEQA